MTKQRSILITGASGGIGAGVVSYLRSLGYDKIACQYLTTETALRRIFDGDEFERCCFQADLTDEKQVATLHDRVSASIGPIQGLINLAGASTGAMSWKMSTEEFTKIVNANLLTTFLTCREFIPEMRRQASGRIINTSSVVAFAGTVGASHYCAAKAGIVGFTKALSLELAPFGITANALALGYFDCGLINHLTPGMQDDVKLKTPLRRFGKVEEVGGLVNYLLSDSGGFTTGQVHHTNGGFYL